MSSIHRHISFHGSTNRPLQLDALARRPANRDPGLFGRIFPRLKALEIEDDALFELASAMIDDRPAGEGNNPDIPAGFTYLGQFVDHDLTLDTTPLGLKSLDPLGLTNFRSPRLDLDSLYGLGPAVDPHLFARDPARGNQPGAKLLLGKTVVGGADPTIPPDLPNDLPRSHEGQALIGDPRNDENLLVAQTHVALLKFHNKVVDHLLASPTPPDDIFDEARRVTTWHYQWVVLHDFVERLVEVGTIAKVLKDGRQFYKFKKEPYIPVEFAVAAYRLGHSMVREQYNHNRVFNPTDFFLLFNFTGKSGKILGDLATSPPLEVARLPSDWIIDWRRFYDLGLPLPPGAFVGASRRIDPFIVPSLHTLPGLSGREAVLPFRNLRRGVQLGLPAGQAVATAIGVPALTPTEISQGPDGAVAKKHGMHRRTPLWYYILKEAEVRHDGRRLGPVGSRILAEVFVGVLQGDPNSFLNHDKKWKPTLPSTSPGNFTMKDLLLFVNDVNPIGDAP